VWERDEFGSPSFWLLQAFGWAGFYLLILLTDVLPSRSKLEFLNQTVCLATGFGASLLLRPMCRSLLRISRPWLSLEVRAFALSVIAGVLCTLVTVTVKSTETSVDWADALQDWLQAMVILFLWCTLYFSIKQWQQSVTERERLVRAESEAREARLSALRYQLNPHFLFNSLNAASTLVLQGKSSAATRMLAQIGELLRTTLDSDASPQISLSQELAFVEQYLAIEQTRLGDRLRVRTRIASETLDAIVPTMLLQPLVENAVRHGIAPLMEGGTIVIESGCCDDRLLLTILNSGPRTNESLRPNDISRGIGLTNTAERLKALYGENHSFSLRSEESSYKVNIEIPLRKTIRSIEGICAH
jgi:two-component system, LytTR family, sensor kinase